MVRHTITADNVAELRAALKDKRNACFAKKLKTVALRGEYGSNELVGTIMGVSPVLVGKWVARYCSGGLEALLNGGGRPRNLSVEEEKEFLVQFEEAGRRGQIKSCVDIADAYYKKVGKKHRGTLCSLLRVHGWRYVRGSSVQSDVENGVQSKDVGCWMPPK